MITFYKAPMVTKKKRRREDPIAGVEWGFVFRDLCLGFGARGLFRGGLVLKAHRSLYHSTLGSRVIKTKKRRLEYLGGLFELVLCRRDYLILE